MADIYKYNSGVTPNTVTQQILSQLPSIYQGQADTLIVEGDSVVLATRALIDSVGLTYVKYLNGAIVEMTQGEKDALNAAQAAALILSAKTAAKSLQDAVDMVSRLLRAIVKLNVDQLNIMRTRDRDRSADVAAATNLANLQTRWAARSALTDITYTQAKDSINTLVDGE